VAADDFTVRITFKAAKPYPYDVFGRRYHATVLQRAQFKDCLGDKAPTCTGQNFGPSRGGPLHGEGISAPMTWPSEWPTPTTATRRSRHCATLTLKGGGDAGGGRPGVMETGEFDYAWNLQLAHRTCWRAMAKGGKGEDRAPPSDRWSKRIELNLTEVPVRRSMASSRSTAKHPHPFLSRHPGHAKRCPWRSTGNTAG